MRVGSFGHRIPGFWCGSMGSVLRERVAGRVFAGVMGNWSDGGSRLFWWAAEGTQGLCVQGLSGKDSGILARV